MNLATVALQTLGLSGRAPAPTAEPAAPRMAPGQPPQPLPHWDDPVVLDHLLGRLRRQGLMAALLVVETLPADPAHGAALVQAVGQRLRTCVRGGDEVAQMHPGRLVVVLRDAGEAISSQVRNRLEARLRSPYRLEGQALQPLLRVGRAVQGLHGQNAGDLLRAATLGGA